MISAPDSEDALPNDMSQCASQIDVIDGQIVELLSRRFRLSRHIGMLKADLGVEPFDPNRIRSQTISFVDACVQGGLDRKTAASLIDAILGQVVAERISAREAKLKNEKCGGRSN